MLFNFENLEILVFKKYFLSSKNILVHHHLLHAVSPGSSAVMDEIKNRKASDLNTNTGAKASGGSKSFNLLENIVNRNDQQYNNSVGHGVDDDEG